MKAFNTIGAMHMVNPRFGGQSASMFICGDDAEAKKTVATLAGTLGFEPVDVGPLTQARLLEPLGMLWISMASRTGTVSTSPLSCFAASLRSDGREA